MPARKGRSPKRRKGPTPRNRSRDGEARIGPRAAQDAPARSKQAPADAAAPSARYIPPINNRGPFRPTWHKVTGALLILVGVSVFVLNDAEWFGIHVMPGGHNELYVVLGIAVAAASTWWFGWFDHTPARR